MTSCHGIKYVGDTDLWWVQCKTDRQLNDRPVNCRLVQVEQLAKSIGKCAYFYFFHVQTRGYLVHGWLLWLLCKSVVLIVCCSLDRNSDRLGWGKRTLTCLMHNFSFLKQIGPLWHSPISDHSVLSLLDSGLRDRTSWIVGI